MTLPSLRRLAGLLAALLTGALVVASPGSRAAVASSAPQWHTPTYSGQDLGWPDCPKNVGGLGMPLPPARGTG